MEGLGEGGGGGLRGGGGSGLRKIIFAVLL